MGEINRLIFEHLDGNLGTYSIDELQGYKNILESASETLKAKSMANVIITICVTILVLSINLVPGTSLKIFYFCLLLFFLVATTPILTRHFDNIYRVTLFIKKVDAELAKQKKCEDEMQKQRTELQLKINEKRTRLLSERYKKKN